MSDVPIRNEAPLVAEYPVLQVRGGYTMDDSYIDDVENTGLIQQFWADGSVTWRRKDGK